MTVLKTIVQATRYLKGRVPLYLPMCNEAVPGLAYAMVNPHSVHQHTLKGITQLAGTRRTKSRALHACVDERCKLQVHVMAIMHSAEYPD